MEEKGIKNLLKRIKDDPEIVIFGAFLLFALVYYIWRMFSFAPWYDELYTYNFFISRGPVYAGIHWPVPNNHMGYTALSGFIYVITHSPYISLRGLAFLCSVGNLIMLYMLGKKLMNRGLSVLLCAIYAGAWQVNTITVQGRGYSLSINMMLIALMCLMHLCFDEDGGVYGKRRYYVLWAFSLILGFYTVMTTLYWVVTICFAALCCLLALKKTKRLIRLIIASVWGAVGTIFVYSMVWLAIGSNLLSKEEGGAYFGLSHFNIIASAPFKSIKTGAEYMLATPYIQSVSSEGYFKAFCDRWLDIAGHMYSFGLVIVIIMLIAVALAAITLISRTVYMRKVKNGGSGVTGSESNTGNEAPKEDRETSEVKHSEDTMSDESRKMQDSLVVFSWLVICFVLAAPLTVCIQLKLPYVRVFTFYAVSVALSASYVIYVLFGALKKYYTLGISAIICALVFAQILSADYNMPYGDREEAILDIMKMSDLEGHVSKGEKICLTDCDQEYMYRFLYDEYPELIDQHDADVILVDKDMLDPDAEYHWEFYYDYTTIDHELLSGMKQLVRNTYYEIYGRN